MRFYKDDYNSNIERLANMQMFLCLNLITFEFEGVSIQNPMVDENYRKEVLPSEYYGKHFLNSDFMNKKKVENVIELVGNCVEVVVSEYCMKHDLSLKYDVFNNTYILSKNNTDDSFEQETDSLLQLISDLDLVDKCYNRVMQFKEYYIKEGDNN